MNQEFRIIELELQRVALRSTIVELSMLVSALRAENQALTEIGCGYGRQIDVLRAENAELSHRLDVRCDEVSALMSEREDLRTENAELIARYSHDAATIRQLCSENDVLRARRIATCGRADCAACKQTQQRQTHFTDALYDAPGG